MINNLAEQIKRKNSPDSAEEYTNGSQDNVTSTPDPGETSDLQIPDILDGDINRRLSDLSVKNL